MDASSAIVKNKEQETGENDDNSGNYFLRMDQSRYDAIDEELRCLSDFHRMRQRGGFEEDETGTIVKTAGRTRILKLHHLEDFSDDDYSKVFGKKNQKSDYISYKDSECFRRFQIFNKFARSVCHMKAIARKEIFEAWSMALYVHETFLSNKAMARRMLGVPIKRFADLVCSHGLLSWALLLLASADEHEQQQKQREEERWNQQTNPKACSTQQTTQSHENRTVSAVCVDISMPPSSEKAAGVFLNEYPQLGNERLSYTRAFSSAEAAAPSKNPKPRGSAILQSRWDYVEGPVENLVPHKSTLLVGIHACGRLSDTIIAQAISANSPLALVPCCHSKKILTAQQKKGFKSYLANQCMPATTGIASYSLADTLADFTDALRKERLVDAGYDVREVFIPQEFSLKNRVLLAIPPSKPKTTAASEASAQLNSKTKSKWGIKYFPIPLEDSPEARANIRSIAGRAAAVQRYNEAHPPPALGVNFWLPKEPVSANRCAGEEERQETKELVPVGIDTPACGTTTTTCTSDAGTPNSFTVEALQRVLDQLRSRQQQQQEEEKANTDDSDALLLVPLVKVEDATRKIYHNPEDGRLSKTFRIHYLECRNNKEKARKLHKTLKEVTIPQHFPAVTVR